MTLDGGPASDHLGDGLALMENRMRSSGVILESLLRIDLQHMVHRRQQVGGRQNGRFTGCSALALVAPTTCPPRKPPPTNSAEMAEPQ